MIWTTAGKNLQSTEIKIHARNIEGGSQNVSTYERKSQLAGFKERRKYLLIVKHIIFYLFDAAHIVQICIIKHLR